MCSLFGLIDYDKQLTAKATPHNYVCGALRKFCPLILLRFLAIHQVLLQKRAASGCKIFSQIALANYAVLP